MNPKISVIMSSFNGSRTIDNAIRSIVNQTYTNFEFIICNDCSTDSTWKHLRYWNKKDHRIIIFKNKYNLGLQKSLNKCLKISHGSYIARMDDDDISLPQRFYIQIHFLLTHSNVSFVGSDIYLFDSKHGVYGKVNFIKSPNIKQLFRKNQFCHPDIMIRSSILVHAGGYSENNKYFRIEDLELWLRLYSRGYRGVNIPIILFKWRLNLFSNRNRYYDYLNRFRLLFDYRKRVHMGIIKYIYIILPLIKLCMPHFIKNIIYSLKYNKY